MHTPFLFSAPGRTEIGGNHTDHQHGCVLAAAVHLKTEAEVSFNGTNHIHVQSEGYPSFSVSLDDLSLRESERNTSAALVRGVAAAFAARGVTLQGLDLTVRSDVLPGSGLSSSAAFEVLIGTVLNELCADGRFSRVEIAQIGQYAENVYFGKPSGLMDQLVSSVGGMVHVDFCDPAQPHIQSVPFDFHQAGYALCIIDTGADHADLTNEYAAITQELKALCAFFGQEYLRQIPEGDFYHALPRLRGQVADRAILRAMHVYQENARVLAQVAALQRNDLSDFFRLVNQSGQSSWMYMQNICPTGAVEKQPVAFALALCSTLLNGRGAHRVHGGGFGGTVQAFVPLDLLEHFVAETERVLGKNSCQVLRLSPQGGTRIR